jgi:putative PIN family toxin of toxin-antitoxin system
VHRVVIDTNVLISGIIQKRGYPYKVVKSWENGNIIIITSQFMIEEAEKVLLYPKIQKKYGLDKHTINQTILNLVKYSILVDNSPLLQVIKEDPADNKILSTAVKGKADYIVSGDSHLLNLKTLKP